MNYWIIILLVLLPFTSNSQVVADTSTSNKLLLLEMDYWQSSDDSSKALILVNKAALYRACGLYKNAIAELERAPKGISSRRIATLVNYEKQLNYFLNSDFGYCTDIVIPSKEISDIDRKREYLLIRLQALNETEKWIQCKEEMGVANTSSDSLMALHIQQLPEFYHYVNPERSRRLSAFLPGLGEMKAGYAIKGITSFVINVGLIAFVGYNFYGGYYITGSVSGLMPFLKFYSGGQRLSVRLAEKHNLKEKNKLKQKYTDLINQIASN